MKSFKLSAISVTTTFQRQPLPPTLCLSVPDDRGRNSLRNVQECFHTDMFVTQEDCVKDTIGSFCQIPSTVSAGRSHVARDKDAPLIATSEHVCL